MKASRFNKLQQADGGDAQTLQLKARLDLYSMQVIRLQGCSRMSLGIAVGSADYFDSDFAVTEVADFDFSDPPIRSKMPDNLEVITI